MATLASLKTSLRMRIGEITAGTYSTVNYQDQNAVDELAVAINEGAKKVCEDTVQLEKALLEGRQSIIVDSGVYQVALPLDYISILMLQHYHDNTFYTLTKHPVASLYDRYDPSSDSSSFFQHYDVKGVTAAIIDEGICTNANPSNTRCGNAIGPDLTMLGVRANVDNIYNVRDGSRMMITDVQANYFDGDGLVGGKRNVWQLNDAYLVESGEEQAQLLWLWPPLSNADVETIVDEQAALTFTLTDEMVLATIDVYLSAAQTDPVRVTLEDNAAAGAPYQTADPESVSSIAVSAAGYNTAKFEYGIRLDTSTTYLVSVTDGDGNTVTPAYIKVGGYTGDEALHMVYARYAKTLVNNTDILELPNYCHEAILLWAERMLYMKKYGGRNQMSNDARAEYAAEIEKIKRLIRARDNQALRRVGGGRRTRLMHKNVPIQVTLPLK